MSVRVRTADPAEIGAVMGVLDGAMLETDAERVQRAIEAGDVLVAVEEGRVLGALVLDGDATTRVAAVAVRRLRRGQGIGSTLVETASERATPLVAEFDARVRPFYGSLGFEIERVGANRCRGRLR